MSFISLGKQPPTLSNLIYSFFRGDKQCYNPISPSSCISECFSTENVPFRCLEVPWYALHGKSEWMFHFPCVYQFSKEWVSSLASPSCDQLAFLLFRLFRNSGRYASFVCFNLFDYYPTDISNVPPLAPESTEVQIHHWVPWPRRWWSSAAPYTMVWQDDSVSFLQSHAEDLELWFLRGALACSVGNGILRPRNTRVFK